MEAIESWLAGSDNACNPASGACRQESNFVGREGSEEKKKGEKRRKKKRRKEKKEKE